MFSYGSIPRRCDRAKAYLYFKEWTGKLFEFKGTRRKDDVVRVLLLASLNNGYVEGSAQLLDVCGQTVRNHLKYQEPQRFLQVNRELVDRMKKLGALSKPLILAVDWHDEMYYGDPAAEGVVGTMPKNGSCRAYRFATASVLLNGERVTLAVTPMLDKSLLGHVKRLLQCVFKLGVKVKLLLFDRGYYSADLIRYLDSLGLKYVMHIPWFKKGLKAGEDRTYMTTTHKRKRSEQAVFRLVTLKEKNKLLVFATNTGLRLKRIRKTFRRRWGIETSYRMIGMFLAKTTSKLYRLRKLYFYLAVALYNLWVLRNCKSKVAASAYALKHYVMLSLVLSSFLRDMEAGG
jgi:hypothetical protein